MLDSLSNFLERWFENFDGLAIKLALGTSGCAGIFFAAIGFWAGWQKAEAMPPDNGIGPKMFSGVYPLAYAAGGLILGWILLPILALLVLAIIAFWKALAERKTS